MNETSGDEFKSHSVAWLHYHFLQPPSFQRFVQPTRPSIKDPFMAVLRLVGYSRFLIQTDHEHLEATTVLEKFYSTNTQHFFSTDLIWEQDACYKAKLITHCWWDSSVNL